MLHLLSLANNIAQQVTFTKLLLLFADAGSKYSADETVVWTCYLLIS